MIVRHFLLPVVLTFIGAMLLADAISQTITKEDLEARKGSIPGSPYFTTNILVEELTSSVTFTISNGQPYIVKQ